MGNDMELIEGDAGIGQMFCHTFDESWRHIHANAGDLSGRSLVFAQKLAELFHRFGVTAFGDEHHFVHFGIGGKHQIIVAAPAGSLVDGQHSEAGQVRLGQGEVHVAAAYRLNPMPGLANQTGDSGERHLAAHSQNQGLKQQREARELARPIIGLDENNPAIGKLDPRRPHVEVTFMLEKIEMPVALRLGVVNRMQSFHAFVRKTAAFGEVDGDGQLPLLRAELDIAYMPGAGEAKGGCKQVIAHDHAPVPVGRPRPRRGS
jgi:hypothetical protein